MELTNALRRQIASLSKAKSRREYGLFVAEGTKCVLDTIGYFNCKYLLATGQWLEQHSQVSEVAIQTFCVNHHDIERISAVTTPQDVIAVYQIPKPEPLPDVEGQLILALDRIQDPGNLGTIVRLCDWFGVRHILASTDTVDIYSPKVVQSTMGAISRVKVHYCDLAAEIYRLKEKIPVYGTFLDGDNIYTAELAAGGIVIMGNEGNGISEEISSLVSHRLLIPSYPPGEPTSESLNVATATAITLSEFRRKLLSLGE